MSETAVPNEEFLADLEEAMRDVVDPELGINVVDLGLVYDLNVEEGDAGKVALIDMTLTSAACPLTDVIEDQSRSALVGAGLVNEIKINWVWNPPWGPGQDHRGRPRTAARAGLHRLALDVRSRLSGPHRTPNRSRTVSRTWRARSRMRRCVSAYIAKLGRRRGSGNQVS